MMVAFLSALQQDFPHLDDECGPASEGYTNALGGENRGADTSIGV